MSIAGLKILGSSRLAARSAIVSDAAELRAHPQEPQFGQKPRSRMFPLSPLASWNLTWPVTLSALRGTPKTGEIGAAAVTLAIAAMAIEHIKRVAAALVPYGATHAATFDRGHIQRPPFEKVSIVRQRARGI
jgi:hypothetical protein